MRYLNLKVLVIGKREDMIVDKQAQLRKKDMSI